MLHITDRGGEGTEPALPSHTDVPAVTHDTIQMGNLSGSVDVYEEVSASEETDSSLTTWEAVTIMDRFLRMS